jgi:hypothetical protein
MKRITTMLGMVGFLALALGSPARAAVQPMAGRCIAVPPICKPGTHAMCICESDISMNCKWICASQ